MGNWPSISLVLRRTAPAWKIGLVGEQADLHLLDVVGGDDPAQLAQGAGRDVRLELAADPALERRPLDREPVGVGGDHRHLLAGGADEDSGQNRAHVVLGGRGGDQVDGFGERLARNRQRLTVGDRDLGEVLGRERPDVEARAAAADLDVALRLPQLDLDLVVGERADEVREQPAGKEDGARALDGRVELGTEADLPVGRAQRDRVLGGGDEDSRQRLGRGPGRYRAGDGREL